MTTDSQNADQAYLAFHAAVDEAIEAEIAATRAHLEDLEQKRKAHQELKPYFDIAWYGGNVQIIAQAKTNTPVSTNNGGSRPSRGWGENSHHAIVRKLITDKGLIDFHTRDVARLAEAEDLGLNARQVSNALSRLRSDKFIEPRPERGKGEWHTLGSGNADGPAEAGPSNETSSPATPGDEG